MSGVVPCPLCNLPPRVYVPNSMAGTVDVIDPTTFRVIDHYAVGQIPHHISPAWDLSELYVENEGSSSLTVIDIHTGRPSRTINIPYPYNLYFTPEGHRRGRAPDAHRVPRPAHLEAPALGADPVAGR
jgi:YVTN family beta-propeller protein